jgi:hypothetical protein
MQRVRELRKRHRDDGEIDGTHEHSQGCQPEEDVATMHGGHVAGVGVR